MTGWLIRHIVHPGAAVPPHLKRQSLFWITSLDSSVTFSLSLFECRSDQANFIEVLQHLELFSSLGRFADLDSADASEAQTSEHLISCVCRQLCLPKA